MKPTPWYFPLLRCPDCGEGAFRPHENLSCACGFRAVKTEQPDLRPQNPKARNLQVVPITKVEKVFNHCALGRPAQRYNSPNAVRDSSELFSAAADHLKPGDTILDLGCGPKDQLQVAQHFGLQYVGVDYGSAHADLLADAHAIPFQDASFDAILSYAVLEHLYNPFLATREITRVLKPGGVFFGTVSLGEPFHDSFFHHTAWGVLRLCEESGLRAERLWHSYDTLRSLATMGRYSKLHRGMIRALDAFIDYTPFLAPRKWLKWSEKDRQVDALHRAASICFVIRKPQLTSPGEH